MKSSNRVLAHQRRPMDANKLFRIEAQVQALAHSWTRYVCSQIGQNARPESGSIGKRRPARGRKQQVSAEVRVLWVSPRLFIAPKRHLPKRAQRRADYAHLCATNTSGLPARGIGTISPPQGILMSILRSNSLSVGKWARRGARRGCPPVGGRIGPGVGRHEARPYVLGQPGGPGAARHQGCNVVSL